MASESVKDVLRNGLPSALDRFLGGSTAYETQSQAPITGGAGIQDHLQQPVDTTPGESPRLIAGIDNRITYGVGGAALIGGIVLLVWAAN